VLTQGSKRRKLQSNWESQILGVDLVTRRLSKEFFWRGGLCGKVEKKDSKRRKNGAAFWKTGISSQKKKKRIICPRGKSFGEELISRGGGWPYFGE